MNEFHARYLMKLHMSVRTKLFLSHLLAVFLVSGSIGTFFYMSAGESLMSGLKERLEASAALIGRTIDAADLRDVTGPSDTAKPAYLNTLENLRALRRMNPDIAFLYVMRQQGDSVRFVVDSDETEDQALPGKEYPNVLPTLVKGFTGVSVDKEINTDEWGSFLSGYAPVRNGEGQYLVGIDMRADKVQGKYHTLRVSGAFSFLASIVLAFVFARLLAGRFMAPIGLAISRCMAIAEGRLEGRIDVHTNDEFDQLITACNDMSEALCSAEQKKREAFEALGKAKDELEIRVRQRTVDLEEVNDKLSREIAERINAQKALEKAATTDPLTRLLNRRAMEERIEQEVIRYRRNRVPFAVLMVDLDHFKNVNDTEGHDAGDSVLVETGFRMKSMLRGQDSVCRWGGEEFMVLLPDTDSEGAREAAERIRARIADAGYYFEGKEIALTASFGAAEFGGEPDVEPLIKAADTALYKAKNSGRNRVETAPPGCVDEGT